MLHGALRFMRLFDLWFSLAVCPVVWRLGHNGSSILSFLSNLHSVLQNGEQWLYQFMFPRTLQEGSLSSTPSLAFIVCRFLMMTILTGVRWYLIMFFICISLAVSGIEHLFLCLLAICMSSLEKYLFRSSARFLIFKIYLLLLMLALGCCMRFSLGTASRGYSLVVVGSLVSVIEPVSAALAGIASYCNKHYYWSMTLNN